MNEISRHYYSSLGNQVLKRILKAGMIKKKKKSGILGEAVRSCTSYVISLDFLILSCSLSRVFKATLP